MKRAVALVFLLAACGGDPSPEISLALEAAPDVLDSDNGTTPSAVLRAFLVEDGVSRRVAPTRWIALDPSLGVIDEEGRFIANGTRGGIARIAAELDLDGETLRAETRITVRVRRDVVATPGLSTSVVSVFEGATPVNDPQRAPFLRYPLDGARVPNDVAAPTIQWDDDWEGAGQDLLRVAIESPFARVYGYLDGSQVREAWTVDDKSWALIANSSGGQDVEVEVARLRDDGTYVPSPRVRFWMSSRALHLSLVAWELSIDPAASRLVEIDPARGTESRILELGEAHCAGCHAVAIDEHQLAATIDRLSTDIFDMATGTAIARIEPPLDGLAFQPGGSLLIGSRTVESTSELFAFDRTSGEAIPMESLPTNAGFPTWAPDGRALAFIDGGNDGTDGTTGRTSLSVIPFQGNMFGAPTVLHDGADLADAPEGGETDSHPSYSPDGDWIVFAHGTSSHSTLDGDLPAQSALYLVRATGGEPIRLSAAMGREGDSIAFWPELAPRTTLEEDGTRLYWVAFYSRMPYGNEFEGTRGKQRRQLWVAAFDPSRTDGDPSFAPFRVPGQRIDRDQLGGAWLPRSCHADGDECRVDSECCSGVCNDGMCAPAAMCRPRGASCDDVNPCCNELTCQDSQCVEVIE